MRDLVVDTDVASRLIKGQEPDWVREALIGNRIWLTFVTVGELAKWAEIRSWGPHLRAQVDQWSVGRPTIPYDDSIARTWGQLSARAQLRGRPRPQNDTWVAATCIQLGVGLVTLNRKHFADFAHHEKLDLLGPALRGRNLGAIARAKLQGITAHHTDFLDDRPDSALLNGLDDIVRTVPYGLLIRRFWVQVPGGAPDHAADRGNTG